MKIHTSLDVSDLSDDIKKSIRRVTEAYCDFLIDFCTMGYPPDQEEPMPVPTSSNAIIGIVRSHWERDGFECFKMEHRGRFNKLYDWLGVVDMVAMKPHSLGCVIVGIQATTIDHISHRRRKAEDLLKDEKSDFRRFMLAGGRFVVYGQRPDGGHREEELVILALDVEGEPSFRWSLISGSSSNEDESDMPGLAGTTPP